MTDEELQELIAAEYDGNRVSAEIARLATDAGRSVVGSFWETRGTVTFTQGGPMGYRYVPISEKPLAFIDTETTGLDATVHEVIEYAIVRTNPNGEETLRWATKIKPQNIEAAHPIALEVNGYTEEAWADAPTMAEVGEKILADLKGCVIVGHNVAFDENMLNENLKRAGIDRRIPYHKVDTVTLAYEHLVKDGLTSLSLDNIRRFMGWSLDGAHTALQDVDDCKRLFDMLMARNRPAPIAELADLVNDIAD